MYRSILVPLDGSKLAEAILPHVEELAHRYESKVIFLGIVEPEPIIVAPEPIYTGFDGDSYRERVRQVEAYLTGQQGEFQEKGIKTTIHVGHGPVVEGIIDVAESEQVDLIAMASHGRTGLSRVFYGSVAAGVLHRVNRPLLLIRSLEED